MVFSFKSQIFTIRIHHLHENQDSFFWVDCDARSGSEEDFLTLRFLISTSVTLFCLFFRYLPPKNPVDITNFIHIQNMQLHYTKCKKVNIRYEINSSNVKKKNVLVLRHCHIKSNAASLINFIAILKRGMTQFSILVKI